MGTLLDPGDPLRYLHVCSGRGCQEHIAILMALGTQPVLSSASTDLQWLY